MGKKTRQVILIVSFFIASSFVSFMIRQNTIGSQIHTDNYQMIMGANPTIKMNGKK